MLERIDEAAFLMFPLTDPPVYEPDPATSLAMKAGSTGRSTLDVLLDAMLEDGGTAMVYFAIFNYLGLNLDVVHQMLTHDKALMGLSDGGAHVGTICDASFPTTCSTGGHATGRARSSPSRMCAQADQAAGGLPGPVGPGHLAVGKLADINIIDHAALQLHQPELRADLPAGGRRLLQRATGYRATVKSGVVTYRDGVSTGATPGRLVRC